MSKQTGIIFIDVAKDVSNKLKSVEYGKEITFLVLLIMILTGFSTMNFIAQSTNPTNHVPTVAVPPSTGNDNVYINGSVSTSSNSIIASGSFSMYPVGTTLKSGSVILANGGSNPKTITITWSVGSSVMELFTWSASSNTITSTLGNQLYTSSLPSSVTFNDTFSGATIENVNVTYEAIGYTSSPPVTKSWTVPSGISSLSYTWSASSGGISSSLNRGTYYSSFPTTTTFTYTLINTYAVAYITYFVSVGYSQVYSTFASGAIAVSITQNQNWWNSTTAKYSLTSTVAPNGYTISFSVSHILSMGYGTNAGVDTLYYSGTSSGTIATSATYLSVQGLGTKSNGSTILSFGSEELINYAPVINSKSIAFSGSGSTAQLTLNATEVIAGEKQSVSVQWGDSYYLNSVVGTSTAFTFTHQYNNLGNYIVSIKVSNDPSSQNVFLSTSTTIDYNITMQTTFNPLSGTILFQQGVAAIVVSTDGNILISSVTLSVNGHLTYPTFSYSGDVLTSSYTMLDSGEISYSLIWTMSGGGISVSYPVFYYTPKVPGEYSQWIGMAYNNSNATIPPAVKNFVPVTLTNSQSVSSSNGMTALVVTDWKTWESYINSNVSNIEFFNSTWSPLYAWMENGNTNTSWSDVWVNLSTNVIPADGKITIYIAFFSLNTYNLGAHSYWGENASLSASYGADDNGWAVFYKYWNFNGTSLPSNFIFGSSYGAATGASYTVNNKLTLSSTGTSMAAVMYETAISLSSYTVQTDFNGVSNGPLGLITYGQLFSSSNTIQIGLNVSTNKLYEGYFDGNTFTAIGISKPGGGSSVLAITFDVSTLNSTVFEALPNIGEAYNFTTEMERTNGTTPGSSYIGVGGGTKLAASGPVIIHYFLVRVSPPAGVLPSDTFGSVISVSEFNVLRAYVENSLPISNDAYNRTYIYTIYKQINAPSVYVYYNSSWTLASIGADTYSIEASHNYIYVTGLAGVSAFQVVFIEPVSVYDPYATVVLNLIPSVAIGQVAGVTLPSSFLEVFINSNELYQNTFQAIIGDAYSIKIESAFLTTIYQGTITPTSSNYPVSIYLNFSSIEWTNENQNEAIAVYAEQNGLRQAITMVNPTATTLPYYFPATSTPYDFTFVYYNYSEASSGIFLGYIPIKAVSANITVSGLMSQVFFGFNLVDMSQEINQTQDTISSAISNIQVILYGQGANIENLTLSVLLNMSIDNSNVQNILEKVILNQNFTNSLLNNMNVSTATKINFVDSLLNSTTISTATKINFVDRLLNETGYYKASYPITITNPPTGTGMYQQLFTISNPLQYGINSQGSNVQFTAQNGTLLYAWIQSINSTSMQVWVKNYYGNSIIDMQVLPSFENLFSSTGYLGEAPQLSSPYNLSNNMLKVFPIAFAFTDHISNFWNYNSTSNAVNGVDGKDGLNFFVNSATAENVYITRHVNDLQNYYFGFTVSSYSNGSVLANWWNGTNTFQTGAITVNHIGNYVITNTTNEATPIFDNDAVYPAYMTISDVFFYSALTMPTFTIGSPTYTNTTLYVSMTNMLNLVNSTLDNVNFNLTTKVNFVDSLLNSTSISTANKINFVASLLNNTNISIQNKLTLIDSIVNHINTSVVSKINFVDSLLNNTNVSIHTELNSINSVLTNVNLNLTNKITFVDSLVNNTNISIQTKLTAINSLLNNVNLNITNKVKFVDSLLNNTNVSIQNKLSTINSVLTNVNLNLTNKISFTDSILNNTNLSIQNKLTIINSLLSNLNVNVTNKIKFIDSLVNSTNVSIQTKLSAINSVLTNVNLNVTNKIKFVDSLLNSTNISLQNQLTIINSLVTHTNLTLTSKVDFIDSLLNNTNVSIQSKLTIINTMLDNVNLNVTNKVKFVDSLLNNTNLSIQNKLTLINSLVSTLNVNVTNKISFVDSLLNNTNISIHTTLNSINSILTNVNLNITNKVKFVDSLLNDTNISIQTKLTTINSLLNTVNLNISSKVKFIDSLLNNTNISIQTKLTTINSVLTNVNLNVTNKIKFVDSLLNNTNISIQNQLTIINSLVKYTNVTVTSKIDFVDSLLNSTGISIDNKISFVDALMNNTNISIQNKLDLISSYINNANISIMNKLAVVDSAINDANVSIMNKVDLAYDYLISTNVSLESKLNVIHSLLNNSNVSVTSQFNLLNSTLKNDFFNLTFLMNVQDSNISKSIFETYLVYNTEKTLWNYVASQGSGVIMQDPATAIAYQQMTDPFETVQYDTYQNSTIKVSGNLTTFFSSPVNTTYSPITVSSSILYINYNSLALSSNSEIIVSYQNGKTVIARFYENGSMPSSIPLNTRLIADGYVLNVTLVDFLTSSSSKVAFQLYTQWSGVIDFVWTESNLVYSGSFTIPNTTADWNNTFLQIEHSGYHYTNVTYALVNVLIGFPSLTNAQVNSSTVQVENLATSQYLKQGVNYEVYPQQGIEFGLSSSAQYKYYISFTTSSTIVHSGTLSVQLSSPVTEIYDNKQYYEKIGTYTESANQTFSGEIVLQFNITDANGIIILVNGVPISNSSFSYSNGLIILYNQIIQPGKIFTVAIYYHVYSTYNIGLLFTNIYAGLNLWWMVMFLILITTPLTLSSRNFKKHVGAKHAFYAAYVLMIGTMVILYLMHLRGIV